MAIELFRHNMDAYGSAVLMLDELKKAAVVHPTGTGKSFIGFKLCEDHPDKTICWLSPSRYIFQTQLENLKEICNGYEPENIYFETYAKLMLLTDEELKEIKPDYIILDEFHRCGAEFWGKGVQRLLKMYPDVPVLGLSATAIRYLDNQRNMTEELFDGNVASEMTLGEALVRGILKPPKYIMSIYSYQKELEKYEKLVRKTRSQKRRDAAEEYLEALRRALSKADKLDVIFAKHMTEKNGKYIVFCANRDHMQEMIEKAAEWFSRVDKAPHIYSVVSDDSGAAKSFMQFKLDNDPNHLKLLYCIDTLNEGVHIDHISGVILLRPTVSPIIYKQQIGRALSAAKSGTPVIFDIVNNIENLYGIDSIREEMLSAVQYFKEYDRAFEIVHETFEVSDEMRSCLELFNSLKETLTFSWEAMFQEAKRYYEQNGHLSMCQKYVTEKGYPLGSWVVVQRRNYHQNNLSDSRIQKLESIGMNWLKADDRLWNESYEICKKYYEKHRTLEGVGKQSVRARTWIVRQREKYNHGELDYEKIEMLNAIGMIWNLDDIWYRQFECARAYYEQYGNLDIPVHYITKDGFCLGNWYRTVRKNYLNRTYDAKKMKMLESIGMNEISVHIRNWLWKYESAKKYFEEHGNLIIPQKQKADDGTSLGIWISTQREKYHEGTLTPEQIQMLESIGMDWNRDDARWNKGYTAALQFAEEYGDINKVTAELVYRDYPLGRWVSAQRTRYRKGYVSKERIEKLERLGLKWNVQKDQFDVNLEKAREFYQKHGHLNPRASYVTDEGFRLGEWIRNLRAKYHYNKLSAERIQKLEAVGMIWSATTVRLESELRHAREYFTEHGNLDIPVGYTCEDGYRLGQWLRIIRRTRKEGTLTAEYIQELDSMNIIWNPMEKSWLDGYSHLKAYYEENGHGNVPEPYICADGYLLGKWLRGQKRSIRERNGNKHRIETLTSLGVTL